MHKKLTPYELTLTREIMKLNRLNGSLLGSLEALLRLDLDGDIKSEIGDVIKQCRLENMQNTLDQNNLSTKITTICFAHFNLPTEKALDDSREAEVIKAKYFGMYFMKEELNLSTSDIGRYFNKSHSTVIHALNKMKDYLEIDKSYVAEYEALKSKMKLIYI